MNKPVKSADISNQDRDDLPKICVIMRSFNDIELISDTLKAVFSQSYLNIELWNLDSSSTDGTLELIKEFNEPERIILNDSRNYNPGRIINEGMSLTDSEIVVFINSDATPERNDWLERLVEPLVSDASVGAVFGRQTSRPDCRSLFIKDNERAFGDGQVAAQWRHFFSMANSAIRRSVWREHPFETRIQFSEDIEWTYRLKNRGHKIAYVADAPAIHSHNYNLKQSFNRHFGEGKADAWIYRGMPVANDIIRSAILPFGAEVLRDFKWATTQRSFDAFLHTVPLRFAQKLGRWRGLNEGRRSYG